MEVARLSPPRPSKLGVAFAEQSTKNSTRPRSGAAGSGVSSSVLTPTRMSVLARRRWQLPLAWLTTPVSSTSGRMSPRPRPSARRLSSTPWQMNVFSASERRTEAILKSDHLIKICTTLSLPNISHNKYSLVYLSFTMITMTMSNETLVQNLATHDRMVSLITSRSLSVTAGSVPST